MPSKAKKAKNNNKVIKNLTFGKKKVKLGKVLKRANTTNTTIETRKVVLLEQLKTQSDEVVLSYRGLSLEDLCRQLGHYNETVYRDAIIGVKQLFSTHPEYIPKNLRLVIPSLGRLISTGVKNSATRGQLKILIRLICNVPTDVISSHFELLSTHVLTGLTDIRQEVRLFAFEILLILLRNFPNLCAQRSSIFEQYLELMSGQRKPTTNNKSALIRESMELFLNAFGTPIESSYWITQEAELKLTMKLRPILPKKSKLFFPVIYGLQDQTNSTGSTLQTSRGLLKTCQVISHLCSTLLAEEYEANQASGGRLTESLNEIHNIINKLLNICSKFIETNCPNMEFKQDLKKTMEPLLKSRLLTTTNKILNSKITSIFSNNCI